MQRLYCRPTILAQESVEPTVHEISGNDLQYDLEYPRCDWAVRAGF